MQLDHDLNRPTGLSSGSRLAIIVAVKLALVATVFLFLYLGADYLGAGLGVLAAHLIVLGVAALILLRGGLGHSALFGGARHRAARQPDCRAASGARYGAGTGALDDGND